MASPLLVLLLLLGVLCIVHHSHADPLADGLLDPDTQPKFVEPVPEALSSNFKISLSPETTDIGVYSILHETGLIDENGTRLITPVFGYGTSKESASWPGPTLEVRANVTTRIRWVNNLFDVGSHPFTSLIGKRSVVDTSYPWAYSMTGYQNYSFEKDGIPMGNMTTGEMGNMTTGDMGNMTTGEMGNMTTGEMGNMTTGEMGNMTTGEMGNMTTGEMGNTTMEVIKLCKPGRGAQDGVCLEPKQTIQLDGSMGQGYRAMLPANQAYLYNKSYKVEMSDDYLSENGGKKDVVTALPGQVTVIRVTFSKRGKYPWHCHILSHEDYEMMRHFEVV
jgi:FtsP/CotA-like multicopper oxidase with cupredoxin domain